MKPSDRPRIFRTHRGSIFVWVMVAMVGMVAVILVTTNAILSGRNEIGIQLTYQGQVFNVARAGLVDALSWFRRQTTQPVSTFAPQLNLAAVPPVNDTDDPAIGLVRSFQIGQTSGVWGRYEVRISTAKDVTGERNLGGVGAAWYIESVGYVYELRDSNVAFNVSPNRILGYTKVATELRRLSVVPPAGAALCGRNGSVVTIGAKGRIDGGTSVGIVRNVGTCVVTGEVVGTPAQSIANPFLDALQDVFGMSEGDLRSSADFVVTNVSQLPATLPSYQLIFIDGSATFTPTRPLNGSGIMYVKGNLAIDPASNSFYSGLIYVTGTFTQRAPSLLKGVVIVQSTVNVAGTGDYSEIDYDNNIINDILRLMGQYRFAKAPYVVP